MKFICNRTMLANAVSGAARAVSVRTAIPILEGVYIKAEGFNLTLTCYNLEISITTTIEANVLSPGETVLSAKLLSDMLRHMQSDEIEANINENNNATIKGGRAEFRIMGMNPGDFPDLPNPGADKTLDIDAATLREITDTTLYAVSVDEKRPAHTGEQFVIEPDKLTVVALDGFRLAIIEKKIASQKEARVIVPAKTMSEVTKLFTDDSETVHISANRRFIVFSSMKYTVISRLIEGEFLDYQRVIPDGYKTRAVIDVRDFISLIERASLIITERLKNPLRVSFEKDKVTVRCQTTLGKVVDEIPAEVEGENVEIGFNNRYLLDALRNSHADKLLFELSGPLSPVKVLPVDKGDFLFLVLPVRFKND